MRESVNDVESKVAAAIEFYASANFSEVISVTSFDKSRNGTTWKDAVVVEC